MKKRDPKKKLQLKKSIVANLNHLNMRNIVGASNLNNTELKYTNDSIDNTIGSMTPTKQFPTTDQGNYNQEGNIKTI